MNIKKTFENRIRGWLPKTPNLPKQPSAPSFERTANYQQAQTLVFAVPDAKIKENAYFLMGFGVAAVFIGFSISLFFGGTYTLERQYLVYNGLNPSATIFEELVGLIAFCLAVGVVGMIAGLLGFLIDKRRSVKEFFYKDRPNRNRGNFLFQFGVQSSSFALFCLFDYLLSPWTPLLVFVVITGLVALGTLVAGVLILKRR